MGLRHDMKFICNACQHPVNVVFIDQPKDLPVEDVERYVGQAVVSTLIAHIVWECPLRNHTREMVAK